MYYQNYEDYMRSVLGYPKPQNTYETFEYAKIPYETPQAYANTSRYSSQIMELYPEIYKIVNPMICKICETNTKPLTRELIEQMTEEVFVNLESQPEMDTVVNIRVNAETANTEPNNRNMSVSSNNITKTKKEVARAEKTENREIREDRQRRPNNILRDLIKILILNNLLGGSFPNRPPRPPQPPRPPMRPPYPREDGYYF